MRLAWFAAGIWLVAACGCATAQPSLTPVPTATGPLATFTARVYPSWTPSATPDYTPTPTETPTPTPQPTQSIEQIGIQWWEGATEEEMEKAGTEAAQARLENLKGALLLWTNARCSNPPFALSEVSAFVPVCGDECGWVVMVAHADGSGVGYYTVANGNFGLEYPAPESGAYRLTETSLPTEVKLEYTEEEARLGFEGGTFAKLDLNGVVLERMNRRNGKWGKIYRSTLYPEMGGYDMSQACIAEGCFALADSVPWREGSGADIMVELTLRTFAAQQGLTLTQFHRNLKRDPVYQVMVYLSDDAAPALLTPVWTEVDFSKPVRIEFLDKRPIDGSSWTMNVQESKYIETFYWQGMRIEDGQLVLLQNEPIFSWYARYSELKGGYLPYRLSAHWQLVSSLSLLNNAEVTTSATNRLVNKCFTAFLRQENYRNVTLLFSMEDLFGAAASEAGFETNSPVIFIPND